MPILYVQVGRKDGRARRHIATLELPTFKLPTLCEMVSRFFFFLRFIARLHWKIWTIRVYSLFLSLSEKLFTRISENICLLLEFLKKEKVLGIGILLILLDLGFLVFSCTLNFQSFGGIFINHLWSSREFIVRDDLFDSQSRRGRGRRFRKLLETCLYMQACFRYSNCGW